MHEPDAPVEDRLRRALHDEAADLPFTVTVGRLEQRLAERRRTGRVRALASLAAAAALVIAVGLAAVSFGQRDSGPAATSSPSVAPSTSPGTRTVAPTSSLGFDGIPSFEDLATGIGTGVEVLRRERRSSEPWTTVELGAAGQGDPLTFLYACSGSSLEIDLVDRDEVVGRTEAACTDHRVTSGIGPGADAEGLRVRVTAPVGDAWRIIVVAPVAPPRSIPGCVSASELAPDAMQLDRATASGQQAVPFAGFRHMPGSPDDGDRAGWLIPPVADALGGPLANVALIVQAGCADSWRVRVASTSEVERAATAGGAPQARALVAAMPDQASPVIQLMSSFDTDVVLRIEVRWWTTGDDAPEEVRYLRIVPDKPEPTPETPPVPHPDPTVPCGDIAAQDDAPLVTLVHGDRPIAVGSPTSDSWKGSFTDGADAVPESTFDIASGKGLRLDIDHDICAVAWSVTYAQVPPSGLGHEAVGDLLTPQINPDQDPAFAAENRFMLDELPSGEWWIQAHLSFGEDGAEIVNWRVTVP